MKTIFSQVQKIWLLQKAFECKDLKKAATVVGISSSAITQSLKSLEEYFGSTLFIREGGSISLTEEGSRLLEYFEPLLQKIGEYSDSKESIPRKIKIGAYDSLARRFFPLIFDRLLENWPDVKIDLVTGRSYHLAHLVRQGHIDMALVVDQGDRESFTSHTLYENYLGLFVHKSVTKRSDPIRTLGVASLSPDQKGVPPYLMKIYSTSSVKNHDIKVTTNSFETILKLTLKGQVVGILPYDLAKEWEDELILLNDEVDPSHTGHDITLISRNTLSPEIPETITALFKEIAGE